MAKQNNDVAFVSPFGTARYPYLETPDTKFDEDGKYHLGVVLTESEAEAIEAKSIALFKKSYPDVKNTKGLKLPIKETEDGNKYLHAKSGYKPKVYDAKKKPLPEGTELGGGSRVRIAGNLHPFNTGSNKGVTMYLQDVQFTKLVARGSGGMMDEVEDEGDYEDTEADTEVNGDEDIDI